MIKLVNILEKVDDVVDRIEQEIFRFNFLQKRYYKSERQKPGYKRELARLLPIVKKLGFEKAKEIDKVVRKYTATTYGRMNKSLRADKVPANATQIDQYIEVAPKFTGSELYRGIGKELYQTIITAKSKNFIDKAFMSATKDYATAEHFARRTGKGAVLVLTGAIEKAAQAPQSVAFDDEEGEAEYIFPRNTRMKIIKIEGEKIFVKVL